jgi:hypothetical protein
MDRPEKPESIDEMIKDLDAKDVEGKHEEVDEILEEVHDQLRFLHEQFSQDN